MIATHIRRSVLMLFGLVVVVVLSSCSKKEVSQDEPLISPSGDTGGAAAPIDEGVGSDTSGTSDSLTGAGTGDLGTVYFDFDSYSITGSARDTLSTNANWLKSNANATIQIEGHCDERGTTEYNLALGERRANAARDYLVRLGVSRSRISVISYGEERPAEAGHDESAWGRNRRAVSVVLSR